MNISDDIKNDFSKGSVRKHIVRLAVPMTVAMLVQMLYNLVDRIYIGHLPEDSANAFTGLGLTFPIVTLVLAFTNLFGTGGAPLCSIDRGRHETAHAEKIMGNTFTALLGCSLLVMALCYPLMKPILYLFGASDATYPYAAEYLNIYLIGTPLVMLATGMNGFINVQGYTKYGMVTVAAGAVVNIALDPLFIFVFEMGVKGAAVATVLSQAVSAAWVILFLCGKKTTLRLRKQYFKPEARILKSIVALGTTGFVMNASNGAVQIACNATLKSVGGVMLGDMYIGIMTALNSLRDVVSLPIQGLTNASQPVIGYNLGAGQYRRIWNAMAFTAVIGIVYMALVWLILFLFPRPLLSIFVEDQELLDLGVPAMHLYFFGFFFMAFQFTGQSTFVGLGKAKQAVFFSLFRKIIIVVPLTLLLPRIGTLGVNGVFIAEPISNLVGGLASFLTMIFTLRRMLKSAPAPLPAAETAEAAAEPETAEAELPPAAQTTEATVEPEATDETAAPAPPALPPAEE